LELGYVGVVNKSTSKSESTALTTTNAMIDAETQFFKAHKDYYNPQNVGSNTLRLKLMNVLETHMARSLEHITDKVGLELDDARYAFKVYYNDRRISPESYVADCMDALKHRFKEFTTQFDKPKVKESIQKMLESRILEIMNRMYWEDSSISEMPRTCNDNPVWDAKIGQASAQLTRSGVGKASVQLVVDQISSKLQEITSVEPWGHHSSARQQVMKYATDLLRAKFHSTVDQVENTIKPYKFEVDCNDSEWTAGQNRAAIVLQNELDKSKEELIKIKSVVGRRKLRHCFKYLNYLDQVSRTPEAVPLKSDLSDALLEKARQAQFFKSKITLLQARLAAVQSSQCSSKNNKACCPEVFQEVIAEKLASTAVLFISMELLGEFFFQLPRIVDNKLYYSLDRDKILEFCRENKEVGEHLRVQSRKETLEEVMTKLRDLGRGGQ
jgi:predicted transcriptional regulator